MNEALYLFRAGGTSNAFYYYLGTLPFILGFLYFWNDMSSNGFAGEQLTQHCLMLTIAFVWMKTWQTVFSRRLYHLRLGLEMPRFTFTDLGQITIRQATIQPWGLFLLPLSLLVMFPFGWVHAFFQNVTILDDGQKSTPVFNDSIKMAKFWPSQNHILIWILSPLLMGFTLALCLGLAAFIMHFMGQFSHFWAGLDSTVWIVLGLLFILLGLWPCSPLAFTIALNIGIVLFIVPILLNSLFGVQTVFLKAGIYGMANTTMILSVYAATHLLLDPLIKTAYVLRCFYGYSVTSGYDLLADLKTLTKKTIPTALLLLVFFMCPTQSNADQSGILEHRPILTIKLDKAINKTLQKTEYHWRIPRVNLPKKSELGHFEWFFNFIKPVTTYLEKFGEELGNLLVKLFKWLEKNLELNKESTEGTDINWSGLAKIAAALLAGAAILYIGYWLINKHLANKRPTTVDSNTDNFPEPNLNNEELSADLLPENQWLDIAQQMMDKNDLRLALRAFYLASLAYLDGHQIIHVKPSKSNKEYSREIYRLSHSFPNMPSLFQANIHLFEKVWYGNHAVGINDVISFKNNQDQIRIQLAA